VERSEIPSLDYCPTRPDLHPAPSNFELATAETFALLKAQTSAAAGVSLSKQTMHRAHDPGAETFGRTGTV